MAGVSAEVQFESPQKHRAGDDGLAEIADWVKTKEEAEAKAEAARLTEEPTKKKSNKGLSRVEATTVVTGRPTTNHLTDTNDLLTYAEPRPPVKVDLSGKNWIGQLFGMYHDY
jgi:hypothetical protein